MRKTHALVFALAITVSACGPMEPREAITPSSAPDPTATAVPTATPTSIPTVMPVATSEEKRTKPLPPDIIHKNPALVDNSSFEITPIERLHTTGRPVEIDTDEYRLVVEGSKACNTNVEERSPCPPG